MTSVAIANSDIDIERFFDMQINWSSINKKPMLKLRSISLKNAGEIVCPYCKNTIYSSDEKREIQMLSEKNRAIIRIEIKNLEEIVECILSAGSNSSVDVLQNAQTVKYETLIIDASGKTFLSLENQNNEAFCTFDLTENFDAAKLDPCLTLLSQNNDIKAFVISYFRQFWKADLPFSKEELDLPKIITLNLFKGFSRSFYNAIPFKLGTFIIDSSFPRFSNCNQAIKRLTDSPVLKSKKIKNHIFNNQGLLLYLDELETLSKCINNADVFLSTVQNKYIFVLLNHLHFYRIDAFIKAFCENKDRTCQFPLLLERSVAEVCRCAEDYAALNELYRKRIKETNFLEYLNRINRRTHPEHQNNPELSRRCSLPMNVGFCFKKNATVGGFTFAVAESTNETYIAGKTLSNCLVDWSVFDNTVFLMKNCSSIVAAIELSPGKSTVYQAKMQFNESIQEDRIACEAFMEWCKSNDLNYDDCEDLYYYDYIDNDLNAEELPF